MTLPSAWHCSILYKVWFITAFYSFLYLESGGLRIKWSFYFHTLLMLYSGLLFRVKLSSHSQAFRRQMWATHLFGSQLWCCQIDLNGFHDLWMNKLHVPSQTTADGSQQTMSAVISTLIVHWQFLQLKAHTEVQADSWRKSLQEPSFVKKKIFFANNKKK